MIEDLVGKKFINILCGIGDAYAMFVHQDGSYFQLGSETGNSKINYLSSDPKDLFNLPIAIAEHVECNVIDRNDKLKWVFFQFVTFRGNIVIGWSVEKEVESFVLDFVENV